jgi:hypothetical protein
MAEAKGFRILDTVLEPAECATLAGRLASCRSRSRAGARHLMTLPEVAQVVHDERLRALAR